MTVSLTRPAPTARATAGPLAFEQFQTAYVTNDIDRACEVFAQRYGMTEFRRLEGPLAAGGHIRIEVAWAGGCLYELVWASGPGGAFYTDRLPADRFAIRHHHLGFLVPTEAAWEGLRRMIAEGGWQVALETEVPGFMRACYIEAPELEHYLEYIFPEPAGLAFFETAPGH